MKRTLVVMFTLMALLATAAHAAPQQGIVIQPIPIGTIGSGEDTSDDTSAQDSGPELADIERPVDARVEAATTQSEAECMRILFFFTLCPDQEASTGAGSPAAQEESADRLVHEL